MAFDLLSQSASSSGVSPTTHTVYDPATGRAAREFAVADADHVDAVVSRAHRAWEQDWKYTKATKRAEALRRIAAKIRVHADEIATLDALEVGKPWTQARHFDLEMCIASFEYFAGLLADPPGSTRCDGPITSVTELDPYGVIAGILPFNWPPIHTAAKCAPALAAGNAVVLKPPEQAPSSVVRLCELIASELPAGLLGFVCGGVETAEALIRHPKVAKVSFTGSPSAGRAVAAMAGQRLIPTLLELGGKNALIVMPGADLDAAVRGSIEGAFFNQGEACTAASRLVVHESVHDQFVDLMSSAVSRLVVGHPMNPGTHIGPLVSRTQQSRVLQYLDVAVVEGAQVAAQSSLDLPEEYSDGYWVPPTLLMNVAPNSTVGQEEIFGPITSVTRFCEPEEAIEIANGTPFALVASIYEQDQTTAWNLAHHLDAGIVFINNYNRSVLGTPFGGNRQSGYGREHAPETLHAFGRSKSYRFPNGSSELPRWSAVDEVLRS